MTVKSKTVNTIFQSTLSVRRATHTTASQSRTRNISIHALRKESDRSRRREGLIVVISIHALRKESDKRRLPHHHQNRYFNPRSP